MTPLNKILLLLRFPALPDNAPWILMVFLWWATLFPATAEDNIDIKTDSTTSIKTSTFLERPIQRLLDISRPSYGFQCFSQHVHIHRDRRTPCRQHRFRPVFCICLDRQIGQKQMVICPCRPYLISTLECQTMGTSIFERFRAILTERESQFDFFSLPTNLSSYQQILRTL